MVVEFQINYLSAPPSRFVSLQWPWNDSYKVLVCPKTVYGFLYVKIRNRYSCPCRPLNSLTHLCKDTQHLYIRSENGAISRRLSNNFDRTGVVNYLRDKHQFILLFQSQQVQGILVYFPGFKRIQHRGKIGFYFENTQINK